jgi:RNA polymerase sigma-70 factor (ECF subfamily)
MEARNPLSHNKSTTVPARRRDTPAERRLIAAARAGDARATRELLERAAAPAWRWSHGFCRNRDDADDLAQDVLVVLLRSLPKFRGESSLSTWTYVVARRACARRRMRERRQTSLDAPDAGHLRDRPDPAAGPARLLDRRRLGERLDSAIASLPEAQRAVLVMRDVEGLSAAEVGEVLGIGERAVKSRLHRARLELRERLAPLLPERAVRAACRDCGERPMPVKLRRAVRRAVAASAHAG